MAPPKKLSWASDGNLRQLRFFSSYDAPALFGSHDKGRTEVKSSLPQHSIKIDANLVPPGFDSPTSTYRGKRNTSNLPLIMWKQPPKFILNTDWLVADGGESEEFDVQSERQKGISEAIYSSSSIPPDPSFALEAKNCNYDDARTPLIPIAEVDHEEQDTSILENSNNLLDTSSSVSQPNMLNLNNEPDPVEEGSAMHCVDNPLIKNSILKALSGAEPDIEAAASVVFTAILKSSAKGSLVDRELLVKILSNPEMIEKLAAESRVPKQSMSPAPSVASVPSAVPPVPSVPSAVPPVPSVPSAVPPVPSVPSAAPSPTSAAPSPTSAVPSVPSLTEVPVLPFSSGTADPAEILLLPIQQPPASVHRSPSVAHFELPSSHARIYQGAKSVVETPSKDLSYYKSLIRQHGAKDANYYKSLIQQHGGEKQEVTRRNIPYASGFEDHFLNSQQRIHVGSRKLELKQADTKSILQKPCAFFGSRTGCKRGVNCLFHHDYSLLYPSVRPEKRSKLD